MHLQGRVPPHTESTLFVLNSSFMLNRAVALATGPKKPQHAKIPYPLSSVFLREPSKTTALGGEDLATGALKDYATPYSAPMEGDRGGPEPGPSLYANGNPLRGRCSWGWRALYLLAEEQSRSFLRKRPAQRAAKAKHNSVMAAPRSLAFTCCVDPKPRSSATRARPNAVNLRTETTTGRLAAVALPLQKPARRPQISELLAPATSADRADYLTGSARYILATPPIRPPQPVSFRKLAATVLPWVPDLLRSGPTTKTGRFGGAYTRGAWSRACGAAFCHSPLTSCPKVSGDDCFFLHCPEKRITTYANRIYATGPAPTIDLVRTHSEHEASRRWL